MIRKAIQKIIGTENAWKLHNLYTGVRNYKYSRLLKQNEQFRNCHNTERCFVLGNGPSLKMFDFKLLKDEITFTVNQLPRNPDFASLHTNYHFWADNRFFDLREDCPEDMELLQVMKNVNTSDNKPTVFYKVAAYEMIHKYGLDKSLNIHYYDEYIVNTQKALRKRVDFTHRVPNFHTVVHYTICMAVYMGFKEIYLLGCDCTGLISTIQAKLQEGKSEYGYPISLNEKKRMEKMFAKATFISELKGYLNLLYEYEWLGDYCKCNHVKLYNATPGGLLECLPRVSLAKVLESGRIMR